MGEIIGSSPVLRISLARIATSITLENTLLTSLLVEASKPSVEIQQVCNRGTLVEILKMPSSLVSEKDIYSSKL